MTPKARSSPACAPAMAAMRDPRTVSIMIKPVGAACNLECGYCYYCDAPGAAGCRPGTMSSETLDAVLAGYLPYADDVVTISWQGGEPTLAGLPFFERMMEAVLRRRRPGQRVQHALQTNGILIDDRWGKFLSDNQFLVGLSIDGPEDRHDVYRRRKGGEGSHAAVLRGLDILRKHNVPVNVLAVVTRANADRGEDLLRYLLNLGARWIQLIPAVEWRSGGSEDPAAPSVTPAAFTPDPAAYAGFLKSIFRLWIDRHTGGVSIRLFDAVLEKLVRGRETLCELSPRCPVMVTVEADGSLFPCDHFVRDEWRLGRIDPGPSSRPWVEGIDWDRLGAFGDRKGELPEGCRACEWLGLCHGGCPKHRAPEKDGRPGASLMCEAYRDFFSEAVPVLSALAARIRAGHGPVPTVRPGPGTAGRKHARNEPCPCGSGVKYKMCCGRNMPRMP